jgi:hypothetical protein
MGSVNGAGIGYCVVLITLVMMWALCVIAKNERDDADVQAETDIKASRIDYESAGSQKP